MNPTELLQSAITAAEKAAKIQVDFQQRNFKVAFKDGDSRNLVTEVDKACEDAIIEHIKAHHPDHEILGEESSTHHESQPKESQSYRWIIDPIDGTTNFAHTSPFFAVSIGIEHQGKVIAGVVKAPRLNETFTAALGNGAHLNGEPIKVSATPNVEQSLFATGFPYVNRQQSMNYISKIVEHCQGIRRFGSAALDICNVACGRLDGYWEAGIYAWDIAAATIILEEAGGQLTNIDENTQNIYSRQTIASNGLVHEEMRKILNG